MEQEKLLFRVPALLLEWYDREARVLPWRENTDPYRVWVSEIMLQQTRVEAVMPYYERFLSAFPTLADLAAAPEEQLLKLWEGKDRPGDFNQAVMDLGATVCLPGGAPRCEACPLSELCLGLARGTAGELPVKAKKKERRVEEKTAPRKT